ncbi:class I SAM-dependent methyltransferase [Krasilnikovia sp. MM14-A1259]|uniref:class I SAM-dependent methyltransferase n=1 Tax=Krasilnikovia sp. MM14-A1259 TaxID=3373539 RepID=UPI00380D8340
MTTAQHQPSPQGIQTRAAQSRGTTWFLLAALRRPREIGAIAPTGRALAAQAAGLIDTARAPRTVVELGPGSGTITRAIQSWLPPGSTFCTVERNSAMAAYLTQAWPALNVIHGDAADLPRLLHNVGIGPVDLIISALPWSLIPPPAQEQILSGVARVLHPHGTFATIITVPVRPLPAARQFRRRLTATFGDVKPSPIVWRNVPPAHLWICREPLSSDSANAEAPRPAAEPAP